MVQVLPYVPGFGEQISPYLNQAFSNIGGGLQQRVTNKRDQGILEQANNPNLTPMQRIAALSTLSPQKLQGVASLYGPLLKQQSQMEAFGNVLGSIRGQPSSGVATQGQQPQPPISPQQQVDAGNSLGQQIPAQAQPQSSQSPDQNRQLTDDEILALSVPFPNQAKILLDQKKQRNAKEREMYKINEPKLMELSDNQRALKLEDARFRRLEELFKDPSKFPSSFSAALFSKDGQLRDLAYSQLSPEAQESLKLITDNLSSAKDTFGARVTNFDVQTYLKKLPSLLNSPEGKDRVLRDLRIINKINQLHNQGMLDIFDEKGGSDKISYSSAQRLFEKKYKDQLDQLEEQLVSGKQIFDDIPSASDFKGRQVKDKKTGKILQSDGTEWKPVEEKK